jgi:hypothetical protein
MKTQVEALTTSRGKTQTYIAGENKKIVVKQRERLKLRFQETVEQLEEARLATSRNAAIQTTSTLVAYNSHTKTEPSKTSSVEVLNSEPKPVQCCSIL